MTARSTPAFAIGGTDVGCQGLAPVSPAPTPMHPEDARSYVQWHGGIPPLDTFRAEQDRTVDTLFGGDPADNDGLTAGGNDTLHGGGNDVVELDPIDLGSGGNDAFQIGRTVSFDGQPAEVVAIAGPSADGEDVLVHNDALFSADDIVDDGNGMECSATVGMDDFPAGFAIPASAYVDKTPCPGCAKLLITGETCSYCEIIAKREAQPEPHRTPAQLRADAVDYRRQGSNQIARDTELLAVAIETRDATYEIRDMMRRRFNLPTELA